MSDITYEGVAPSTWNLILTDCYNAMTNVKVTLKNGKEFIGYVQKHPAKFLHNIAQIGDQYHQIVFNINVTEIAAITEMR
jgi:hypothetical protein